MEFLDALKDARKELIDSGDYRLLYKILANRPDDNFKEIKEQLVTLNQKKKQRRIEKQCIFSDRH